MAKVSLEKDKIKFLLVEGVQAPAGIGDVQVFPVLDGTVIELRSGDLTRRVHVVGNDEVARTARAFNELVDGFQTAVKKVGQVSTVVVASAEQLYGASGRVASGATIESSVRTPIPSPLIRLGTPWLTSGSTW